MKRLISIVTACYNEEHNVGPLVEAVRQVMAGCPRYDYEHLFIDNCSTDGTVAALRRLAAEDARVKVIINSRNFGHVRSPAYALMQARGAAVIAMAADFQDPPTLIPQFLAQWEAGAKIVVGVKNQTDEGLVIGWARRAYYRLVRRLAEVDLVENYTGFGLYDRVAIEAFKSIDDPYPYFRGLVCEVGFPRAEVLYAQPRRRSGSTKNNLYTLYDTAMLGITNFSLVPLRLTTLMGFVMSLLSMVVAVVYFAYKLVRWREFPVGIAPLVIGLFSMASVQMFVTGILGEYVGTVFMKVARRPLVVEKERINC